MTHIQQRRDTAATWTSLNPVLYDGESGHESDTGREKMGDGETAWVDLPYKYGVDSVAGKTGEVDLVVADVTGAAPLASPVLTGTPKTPTRATSDDSTNIASTEYVKNAIAAALVELALDDAIADAVAAAKLALFPVGAIYYSESATNPGEFIGGTWVRYAKGRMLVSLDEDSVDIFNDVGEEGGYKTNTLSINEMPNHDHGGLTTDDGAHTHTLEGHVGGPVGTGWAWAGDGSILDGSQSGSAGLHNHAIQDEGDGNPFYTVSPYKVCYVWKRTA